MTILANSLGAVLLAAFALKAVSIYRDNRWLLTHGPHFADALRQARLAGPLDPVAMDFAFRFYDAHGGGHWPFGVKGYRLFRLTHRLWERGPAEKLGAAALGLACRLLFRYTYLSLLTLPLFVLLFHDACNRPVLLLILALALVLNLLMTFQSALSYSTPQALCQLLSLLPAVAANDCRPAPGFAARNGRLDVAPAGSYLRERRRAVRWLRRVRLPQGGGGFAPARDLLSDDLLHRGHRHDRRVWGHRPEQPRGPTLGLAPASPRVPIANRCLRPADK